MRELKAVIFDLDDTLFPERDYVYSGFRIVSDFLSSIINIESSRIFNKCKEIFMAGRTCVFNRLLEYYGINDSETLKTCIELYQNHIPDIKLSDDAAYILNWLKNSGYKLGIITDGRPEGQRNKIEALGIGNIFDLIIITDELGGIEYRKPNEKAFVKMLKFFNIKACEAVYIGDNITKDFVAPNKLGMKSVLYKHSNGLYPNTGFNPEYSSSYVIESLTDLKELLE